MTEFEDQSFPFIVISHNLIYDFLFGHLIEFWISSEKEHDDEDVARFLEFSSSKFVIRNN